MMEQLQKDFNNQLYEYIAKYDVQKYNNYFRIDKNITAVEDFYFILSV